MDAAESSQRPQGKRRIITKLGPLPQDRGAGLLKKCFMRDIYLAHAKMAANAFFWGGLAFFIIDITLLGYPFNEYLFWHVMHSGLLSAMLFVGNGILADNVKISWVEYPLRRFVVSAVLTVVITYLIGMTADIIMTFLRHGRLPKEPLIISYDYFMSLLVVTLIISLFMHGRQFLMNYRESIIAQEELKRTQLASRFESLQNQVNPHFLFNSLNVLSNLVYKDVDLSAKFIEQLALVYRYVLEAQNQEVVSLSREREMLDAYLFLLQIRFGEQLDVTIDLPTEQDEVIPPLTLQLLAENAVKHNVISRKNPLQLRVQKQEKEIVVRNTFQPKQQKQESLGIGLKNIRERYLLLSDKTIHVSDEGGWFEVRLPVLQMQAS